jgi:hypothetical protein
MRTTEALAGKKALGTPANLTPAARAKSLAVRAAARAGPLAAQDGLELNEGGYRTRRGNLFFRCRCSGYCSPALAARYFRRYLERLMVRAACPASVSGGLGNRAKRSKKV